MAGQELRTETTVDAKTAERALELALKIQQEQGDRVSIDELHRSAAELGVDPEHVSQALRKIEAEKAAKQHQANLSRSRLAAFASAGVVAILIVGLASRTHLFGIHQFPIILAVMAILALKLIRGATCSNRRWR